LSPLDVIRVLNKEKISFVLVGAYGIVGYMSQARATEDVDLVVAFKHVKKATRLLLKEFPFLEAEDQEVVVRLRDKESQNVLVDLVYNGGGEEIIELIRKVRAGERLDL